LWYQNPRLFDGSQIATSVSFIMERFKLLLIIPYIKIFCFLMGGTKIKGEKNVE